MSKYWSGQSDNSGFISPLGKFLQYGWVEHFADSSTGSHSYTASYLEPVDLSTYQVNGGFVMDEKRGTGKVHATGRYSKVARSIPPRMCRYVKLSGFKWTPTIADELHKFFAEKGLLVGLICGNMVSERSGFGTSVGFGISEQGNREYALAFFYGKVDTDLYKGGKIRVGGQDVVINDPMINIRFWGVPMIGEGINTRAVFRPPRMDDPWFLQFLETFGPTAKSFQFDLTEEQLQAMLWEIYVSLPYDLKPATVPCTRGSQE